MISFCVNQIISLSLPVSRCWLQKVTRSELASPWHGGKDQVLNHAPPIENQPHHPSSILGVESLSAAVRKVFIKNLPLHKMHWDPHRAWRCLVTPRAEAVLQAWKIPTVLELCLLHGGSFGEKKCHGGSFSTGHQASTCPSTHHGSPRPSHSSCLYQMHGEDSLSHWCGLADGLQLYSYL